MVPSLARAVPSLARAVPSLARAVPSLARAATKPYCTRAKTRVRTPRCLVTTELQSYPPTELPPAKRFSDFA